jgi:hypothetical protein
MDALTIGLNGAQSKALAEFISDNDDGEGIALTKQGNGDLYIAGTLASWNVTEAGEVDAA